MDKTYEKLSKKIGKSAATTYIWNRKHGVPASIAMEVALDQLGTVGTDPGFVDTIVLSTIPLMMVPIQYWRRFHHYYNLGRIFVKFADI